MKMLELTQVLCVARRLELESFLCSKSSFLLQMWKHAPLSQAGKFAPSQEVRFLVSQICSFSTQVVRRQVSLNQLFSPSKQRIGIPVSPDFLPHQVKFARRRYNFDFCERRIELCKQLNIRTQIFTNQRQIVLPPNRVFDRIAICPNQRQIRSFTGHQSTPHPTGQGAASRHDHWLSQLINWCIYIQMNTDRSFPTHIAHLSEAQEIYPSWRNENISLRVNQILTY